MFGFTQCPCFQLSWLAFWLVPPCLIFFLPKARARLLSYLAIAASRGRSYHQLHSQAR